MNEDERFDRIAQTLAVIALTLADFRERLEALERPSRWQRLEGRLKRKLSDLWLELRDLWVILTWRGASGPYE